MEAGLNHPGHQHRVPISSLWLTAIFIGLGVAGAGYSQESKGNNRQLKTVEWPGLGKTTAVCVKKNGLYVCVLPEGATHDKQPRVFNDAGEEMPAKLLHQNRHYGLCLLESESQKEGSRHIPLSTGAQVKPGLSLMSLLPTINFRTCVAGKDRQYLGKELPAPLLRVRSAPDTVCQPGTPLINENGELEAIVGNRNLSTPNEAHAIPAGLIAKVINDVENHQKSGPVWVGMRFLPDYCSTPQVVEVKPGSPAEKAGIQPNDVILEVGGKVISELGDLVEVMTLLPGEEETTFKVLRSLDEIELRVVPKFVE